MNPPATPDSQPRNNLRSVTLLASVLGASALLVSFFFQPLSPFWAAQHVLYKTLPLIMGLGVFIYCWINKRTARAVFQFFTFGICMLSVCMTMVAGAFYYNKMKDKTPAQPQLVRILSVGEKKEKNRIDHVATVTSPSKAPLFFMADAAMQISLRSADKKLVKPHNTALLLAVRRGALGLPWMQPYSYQIHFYYSDFITKVLEHMQSGPSKTPKASLPKDIHAIPLKTIVDACNWAHDFNAKKDIEQIPADDYAREFWTNGKPRSVIPLVNGLKHGIEHDTFKDGVVYADIPWKHGKKHGTYTLHLPTGAPDQKLSYKDGELFGMNEWVEIGGVMLERYVYLNNTTYLPASYCSTSNHH